jgi:hypothetical protein
MSVKVAYGKSSGSADYAFLLAAGAFGTHLPAFAAAPIETSAEVAHLAAQPPRRDPAVARIPSTMRAQLIACREDEDLIAAAKHMEAGVSRRSSLRLLKRRC